MNIYKTKTAQLKCNNADYIKFNNLNKLSAQVWNKCLYYEDLYFEVTGKSVGRNDLQKLTKHIVPLHAKGIHYVVHKYLYARDSAWESRKAKHQNKMKANLPYKYKQYFNTGWDYQAIHINKNSIYLSQVRGEPPLRCRIKNIPSNIVEIELVYKDRYYLLIKYKEEDNKNLIQSDNCASIDLGEIHAITSIDKNGECVIITNRKVRSIIRLKDKKQGKLKSLQSKCEKNSKQYRKYKRAIYKTKYKAERQINDAIHKQSKLFLDYCLENKIKSVYYGDLDYITRNSKGKNSSSMNHKLNMWCFGKLIKQLNNKLSRNNIKMLSVKEYYTTQTCPQCGSLNKSKGRNYQCNCGYSQHRDIVGAINILNQNASTNIIFYKKKEYLRIA